MFIMTIPRFLSAGFIVKDCRAFFSDLMEAFSPFDRLGVVFFSVSGSRSFRLHLVSSM